MPRLRYSDALCPFALGNRMQVDEKAFACPCPHDSSTLLQALLSPCLEAAVVHLQPRAGARSCRHPQKVEGQTLSSRHEAPCEAWGKCFLGSRTQS